MAAAEADEEDASAVLSPFCVGTEVVAVDAILVSLDAIEIQDVQTRGGHGNLDRNVTSNVT
jgi:hypothetical protein